jgi:peptidoglycan hydrolase CwlO-like protein
VSERAINLPDGLQPMSEEDLKTIWNKADDARGEEAHMSNDVFDLVNALDAAYAQIDSLQQQLVDKDSAVAELHEYNRRYAADVDHLREQIAERDRKIAWLTNELGE